MSSPSLLRRRLWTVDKLPRRHSSVGRIRVRLGAEGARTTMHVASYDRRAFAARVVVLERPAPLVRWCGEQGVNDAVVGGFFSRPQYLALGQVHVGGKPQPSVAFDPPWGDVRACVQITSEGVRIARRDQLGATPGDLLQAGPLLVADGEVAVVPGQDVEGFSAAAHQFDSDITEGRYPRAALGLAGERLLLVACDGRTDRDAGMTLPELAHALLKLGATDALNLDGGGSSSLIYDGRLRNRPREEHGVDLLEGRSIVTAITLQPR